MPSESPNNDSSIEQLAAMTARGFQDVQEQIKTLVTKDELKDSLQNLDQSIAKRLDSFLSAIRRDYEQRLFKAEQDIQELQRHL